MADPTTMQRRVPLGYKFCPTEQQLVAYYLGHKLMARYPSIYNTIPEIDVCKYEPWEIRAWAALAFPEIMEEDDSECYFFHSCGSSARSKRTTPKGFWKVTGKDKPIKDRDTENVIGNMKILVYHKGRAPHAIQGNWVIHEYHDVIFPPEQRTYVVCKLIKKYGKKTMDFEYENPTNFSILSKEHYLSNMNPTVQTSFHPEVMDSVIHTYQPKEAINSKTWTTSLQSDEEYQSNEDIHSMIQAFYTSNEVLPPELNSIMDPPLGFGYEEFYKS